MKIIEEKEFETVSESWNEYRLNDGTMVKAKVIVSGVQLTDQRDQFGDPVYNMVWHVIHRVMPSLNKGEGSA
jgi:hypothetical protein